MSSLHDEFRSATLCFAPNNADITTNPLSSPTAASCFQICSPGTKPTVRRMPNALRRARPVRVSPEKQIHASLFLYSTRFVRLNRRVQRLFRNLSWHRTADDLFFCFVGSLLVIRAKSWGCLSAMVRCHHQGFNRIAVCYKQNSATVSASRNRSETTTNIYLPA